MIQCFNTPSPIYLFKPNKQQILGDSSPVSGNGCSGDLFVYFQENKIKKQFVLFLKFGLMKSTKKSGIKQVTNF